MPWTQTDTSFKKLQSKRITTSTGKGIDEEKGASALELYLPDIKTDLIPGTPPGATTAVLAYTGSIGQTLAVDTSVPSNLTWFATSGYGNTTSANDGSALSESQRLGDWVSDKYDAFGTVSGAGYEIKVYDKDSNLITKADPSDWLFDYQTGILVFNNANTAYGAVSSTGPFRVVGYRYIGNKGIIPGSFGGSGFTTYTLGDLLVGAGSTLIKFPVGIDNYVLTADSSQPSGLRWAIGGGGGSGLTLNGLTSTTQYFSVGTSGNLFNIVSSGSTHTFNIPIAGAGATGLISTQAQTIAGQKTFTSAILGDLTGTATTAGFATTSSYAHQAGYAITSGLATTATYAHQSGYATTAGLATTATYAHQSGYATTSGLATTATYAHQSGYAITSGLATTATYSHQSGYAITSGFATTSANVNVVNATVNSAHPIIFGQSATGSGVALSSNTTISFNPSTFILSTSGLAITASTTSTSSSTGALIVTGGVGIGGSLFLTTSVPSSLSGVVVNNGVITSGSWAGSTITGLYGGTGYNSYTKGDILVGAGSTFIKLSVGTDNFVLTADNTTPSGVKWTSVAGLSITSVNGLTASAQFFATGTSGNLFNIVSSGSTHTFNIPIAGTGATGLVSTQAQSFAGIKTFTNDVIISSTTGSTAFNTGALTVYGGVGVSGQLSFNQAALGYTGASNPSIAFIGSTTAAPITLTVLSDNSLIWEGTSGKLFGINNNLSSGWIFNVGDISGLPIIRANADGTIAMAEFAANVGIGLSNPSYKLHVAGDTNLSSGYVYRINGTTVLSASSLGTGITNSSLTAVGTITTGVWSATAITALYGGTGLVPTFTVGDILYANTSTTWGRLTANSNSGYVLTSAGSGATPTYVAQSTLSVGNATTAGFATTSSYSHQSGYAITSGFATTASYAYQSGYGLTSGFATTAANLNVVNATTGSFFPVLSNTSSTTSGIGASVNGFFSFNAATGAFGATSVNILAGQSYSIGGNGVLSSTQVLGLTVSSGNITSGAWSGTAISVLYGGTGLTTFTVGDILYASGSSSIGKLSAGTAGSILISAGSGATPYYVNPALLTSGNATTAANINSVATVAATTTHYLMFSPTNGGSGVALSSGLGITYSPALAQLVIGSGSALIDGVLIGANANTITTSSGNLTLNAAGGTVLVAGNLNVQGTATYIDSTTATLVDPVIVLGSGAGGTHSNVTDTQDRGIEFRRYSGSAITGFFGFSNATGRFTVIPNASVTANNTYSGAIGVIEANITGTAITSANFYGTLVGTATTSTNINIVAATAGTFYPIFTNISTTTSGVAVSVDSSISYNVSTSTLTAGKFSGLFSGTAATITTVYGSLVGTATTAQNVNVVNTTTGTFYPLFANTSSNASGVAISVDGGISWNAATDTLTSVNFSGNLSATAATATNFYGTLVGSATTANNINVIAANSNSVHQLIFTPTSGSGSGVAVSSRSTINFNPSTDIMSVSGLAVTAATASTNSSTGALIVTGGVGIGGTVYTGSDLNVGTATTGRLYFSQATMGSAGTTIIPSMAFIGATNSPITLSVLADNSLSFDGSSGQLFSINNNLSSGWIFAVNDISGLPLIRANADGTIAMAEFAGNVGVGISNPSYKLHISGDTNLSSGYVYRINGNSVLSASSLGTGVTNSSLTAVGTISTGSWAGSTITARYGGTGFTSYTKGDLLVGAGNTFIKYGVGSDNQILIASSYSGSGLSWAQFSNPSYGSFYSTSSQQVAAAGATTLATFNNTYEANRVQILGGAGTSSRIQIQDAGPYSLTFSAQLNLLSGNQPKVGDMWFRVNGVDVPQSNTEMTILGKDFQSVLTVNFVYSFQANDYVEIAFSSSDAQYSLEAKTGLTSPPRPDIPSVILSVLPVTHVIGSSGTATSGIQVLNGAVQTIQYFQTGTTGLDFNISTAGAYHTFNIPDASTTARGLVTTGSQTFFGSKTFASGVAITASTASTSSSSGALIVSGGVGIGGSLYTSASYANSISSVVLNNGVITSGSWAGTTITGLYGGTGYTSYSKGDLLVGSGNTFIKLSTGTDGYVLGANSSLPSGLGWTTVSGVAISTSAPSSPKNADLWFNSTDGSLSVYYQDIDTSQWVEIALGSGIDLSSDVHITSSTGSTNLLTGALIVDGGVGIAGTANIQSVVINETYDQIGVSLTTSATTANQVALNLSTSSYRSAKLFVQASSGTTFHSQEIMMMHDGTNVYMTEYSMVNSGAIGSTFDGDISGGNMRFLVTPTYAVTTYKIACTAMRI